MILKRDGGVYSSKLDDEEELAFKLSVLFDFDNFEEMVIEREEGATYLKLFNEIVVYLHCRKKPNATLLNMYLKKIFPAPLRERAENSSEEATGDLYTTDENPLSKTLPESVFRVNPEDRKEGS